MTMNRLMEFRTTYLRSIAEAWADAQFLRELTSSPITALKARFAFDWPWPAACDLEIANAAGSFEWLSDQWIWALGRPESLTLYLPLDPAAAGIAPANQAKALADYYRTHTSLFSDDWGVTGEKPPRALDASYRGMTTEDATGLDSAAPAGGFIPNDTDFASFEVALLAAIAKAWNDPTFRKLFTLDAAAALHTIRDYTVPWDLWIQVKDNPEAVWRTPADDRHPGKGRSYWQLNKRNLLKLYLPTKPADVISEPVALAAYNATGAEYPFSCCC